MAREIPIHRGEGSEPHNLVPGPGLWYVTRNGTTIYQLDDDIDSIPSMPDAERYVLRALIDYVLDKLDKGNYGRST